MGYNTDYRGSIEITPCLKEDDKEFLDKFFEIRHMKRDMSKLKGIKKEDIGKFGKDGCYYLVDDEYDDPTIVDYNNPADMPSLWCNLEIYNNEEGCFIQWNGNEKSYGINDEINNWFDWLIKNFFEPKGYTLNGEMDWRGEDFDDTGKIVIKDNKVSINRL